MRGRFILVSLLIVFHLGVSLYAQDSDRKYHTKFVTEPPKIDGILDEPMWQELEVATDFLQTIPYNGRKATFPTYVKIAYDNNALYVGAFMYDLNPDSILTGLAHRDASDDELNADLFIVELNPYNDDQMLFAFKLSASNVQVDERVTFNNWDNSWNGIWYSETNIVDSGWVAEIKIPYSTLRIPNVEEQTWGLHLWRCIKRYEEWVSWNFVDEKVDGTTHQVGELKGIKNIDPPLRLSFTPYLSTYYEHNGQSKSTVRSLKGGLDLKYGINDSYTLDMMLIPDFGEIQSDDIVYNYGTVETYYNENRQFFVEGTELFNRANIFYSRRIGAQPKLFGEVNAGAWENGDSIVVNPSETQILNAIKVSGRSAKGTAIGVLNSFTENTFAEYYDTLDIKHSVQTQPFTNYNLIVVDQALKNNSYMSLIRTNVRTPDWDYIANVTGAEFMFANKKNSYNFQGRGAFSEIMNDSISSGFYTDFQVNKSSGNFRFHLHNRIYSDTYNPRDMGYLARENVILADGSLAYNFIDPFWRFLTLYNSISVDHQELYEPRKYITTEINLSTRGTFRNHYFVQFGAGFKPLGMQDYFEPRVPGRVYDEPASYYYGGSAGTDGRKMFSLSGNIWRWQTVEDNIASFMFRITPAVRASDRLYFSVDFSNDYLESDGYETHRNDSIVFARRGIHEQSTVFTSRYIFTSRMALSFRGRYYRSVIEKKDFYLLNEDGSLDRSYEMQYDWAHENRNNFNVDFVYTWQFAPGSELSFIWKNLIWFMDDVVDRDYYSSLNKTWNSPQNNSFSIKVLYYLDYQYLKRNGKR